MKDWLLKKWHIVILANDAVVISASWFAAYFIRWLATPLFGYAINPFHIYAESYPVMLVLWVATNSVFGTYKLGKLKKNLEEIQAVVRGVVLAALVVMSVSFLFKEYDFARSVLLIFIGLTFILTGISRAILFSIPNRLRKSGYGNIRCIIVGAGTTGIRALQRISDHPEKGYDVIGFLDDDQNKLNVHISKRPVLDKVDTIREIVERYRIEEVFIAIPSLSHSRIMELIMKCEGMPVGFKIASDLFGVIAHNADIEFIEDFPVFDLKEEKENLTYAFLKRLMDIIIAVILIILLIPFWIIIQILIKLDSKGGIFFVHERIGLNGKPFKIYKFRTMHTATDPYAYSPGKPDDTRITMVGRFLRQTSLDELPNLLNVLKGDMSIVGPRPEMPFIVKNYEEWQKKRLTVKPGITGLWQILGRKDIPLQENLEYDFYYIKNRSFLLDIIIILKTIPAILSRKGAY
jgi:exopolysaccharide biosynthesis polyprenyl glycosylphosphotransferase